MRVIFIFFSFLFLFFVSSPFCSNDNCKALLDIEELQQLLHYSAPDAVRRDAGDVLRALECVSRCCWLETRKRHAAPDLSELHDKGLHSYKHFYEHLHAAADGTVHAADVALLRTKVKALVCDNVFLHKYLRRHVTDIYAGSEGESVVPLYFYLGVNPDAPPAFGAMESTRTSHLLSANRRGGPVACIADLAAHPDVDTTVRDDKYGRTLAMALVHNPRTQKHLGALAHLLAPGSAMDPNAFDYDYWTYLRHVWRQYLNGNIDLGMALRPLLSNPRWDPNMAVRFCGFKLHERPQGDSPLLLKFVTETHASHNANCALACELFQLLLAHPSLNVNFCAAHDGHSALYQSIQLRRAQSFQLLLQHDDIDVNACNPWTSTPLFLAVSHRPEFVKDLLAHLTCDVNLLSAHDGDLSARNGVMYSPIRLACVQGNFDVVQAILRHPKFRFGRTEPNVLAAYLASVSHPKWSVLQALVHFGVDFDGQVDVRALGTPRFEPAWLHGFKIFSARDLVEQFGGALAVHLSPENLVWLQTCMRENLTGVEACLSDGNLADARLQLRRGDYVPPTVLLDPLTIAEWSAASRTFYRRVMVEGCIPYKNYWLYPPAFQAAVRTVVHVGNRLDSLEELPGLAPELWLHVCTFFCRAWWV